MSRLAVIFFVYSFIGWVLEVARAATKQKQYVNKGFLNGSLCPRYGFSMVLIMILMDSFKEDYVMLFLGCALIATTVEYITSVLLEKMTGSRWWDYSNMPLQLQGRICLPMSLLWGITGTCAFRINHLCLDYLKNEPLTPWQVGILVCLTILLIFDYVAACVTALSIQENFRFVLVLAAKLRKLTRTIGDSIFEATHIRIFREEIRRESARMRNTYRKEREKRMISWLKRRMILAAPDCRKSHVFTG